jgi:hypothetical protein
MSKRELKNCALKPGKDCKVIETDIARIWRDNDGEIIYSVAKKQRRFMSNLKVYFKEMKALAGNKKMFIIADVNEMQPYSEEEKQYLINELESFCKGFALISCKHFGKIVATVTVLKANPPFPAKIFENTNEAKA